MHGTYGVVVGDIDQAYEMCDKKDAYDGWIVLRHFSVDSDFLIDKFNRKVSMPGVDYSTRYHRPLIIKVPFGVI